MLPVGFDGLLVLAEKSPQGQVLVHGQARKDAPPFRHLAQAGFGQGLGRRPVNRLAVIPDLPLVDGDTQQVVIRVVDLPAPLAPMMATISPGYTLREIPLRALMEP
jgi:hypothetical protein